MSTRTFLFCDNCNPQQTHYLEQRSSPHYVDFRHSSVSHGGAWIQGDVHEATERYGWVVTLDGRHICPICHRHQLEKRSPLAFKFTSFATSIYRWISLKGVKRSTSNHQRQCKSPAQI